MLLQFLGTSSGTPTKARNVTGLILGLDQGFDWILVDCGEATQHQLLRTSRSVHDLRTILITHVHGDHCYGLPGLLASAAMSGRKAPLTLIGPAALATWLAATTEATALHLPYPLQFMAVESLASCELLGLTVQAIPLSHRVPSWAYHFSEADAPGKIDPVRLRAAGIPQGPLWGRLQAGQPIDHNGQTYLPADFQGPAVPGRRLIIAGDNDRPSCLDPFSDGLQLLVHEATHTLDISRKLGDWTGHSDADRVARWAASRQVPNLVLTHFSPRYQPDSQPSPSIQDIRTEAESVYAGRLYLAEDFMSYRLTRDGVLAVSPPAA